MTKSRSTWKIKPVSNSRNIFNVQRSKLPLENLLMMDRIINAPPGVASAQKLQKEYELHKLRVKTMKKYNESGQLKPVYKYKKPQELNKTLSSYVRQPRQSLTSFG